MTTDSSSVTVPPRKGEQSVRRTVASNLRSKSWEGETQAARSAAAALGDNKKPAGLGWYVKAFKQGIVPAHFLSELEGGDQRPLAAHFRNSAALLSSAGKKHSIRISCSVTSC